MTVKTAIRELADHLPDDASWSDAFYWMVVRQRVEEGLADMHAGRVISHDDLFRELEETDESDEP